MKRRDFLKLAAARPVVRKAQIRSYGECWIPKDVIELQKRLNKLPFRKEFVL